MNNQMINQMNNQEKGFDNLRELEEYIQMYKQLPSYTNTDENIKYFIDWISVQKENYKLNKQIVTNEEINKIWEAFVNLE